MALIHILDKQTDEIIGTLNVGDYYDDEKHSSIDNQNTFDFVALKHFDKLQKRNRLLVQDTDGYFSEYVIEYTEQISHTAKNIWSVASFLDLKKAKIIEPQILAGATATTAAEFALDGTEWEVGRVDSTNIRTITIDEYTNPYNFLKRIAGTSIFGLELRFRVVVDGNRIVGRFVDLLIPDTEFDGKEVTFGKDLVGLRRKEDSSRIVTALLGIGPEREDGTRFTVFVEDRDALQRWGRNGQHLIEVYEPETSDMDMTIERLQTLTKNELKKRIEAIVEYECEAAIIEHIYGKEHEKIRLGDTIRIKDESYTPPLYLEARIQEIVEKPSLNRIVSFKLGNYKEFQKEDLEAQISTLKKLLAQKASNAELTEVYEAALQQAEEKANQAEQNAKEYADTQDSQVKAEIIQYADQQAQQAEENAKEYTDDRLQNTVAKDIFENTVTDIFNNIAQKVDNTRFEQVESELRGIAEELQHEVAEHADMLEEHGGKITKLETDVDEVEGKISATISELEALGDTVSRHETQIDANAQAIALKADKQELDLLSGTVSDISSELSVMAGQIEAKAERSEVERLENDVSKVSQDVSALTIDVDGIKTNVSSISQTVSNHGTQISNINSTLTQHANLIASKVDATTYQQDKNGIITRIENAESRITQTENAIQTKVERSEFDSVTNSLGNRISTIEQTADSISLEVSNIKENVYTKSEVDSAIGNIQIGGRNFLTNSDFSKTYKGESFTVDGKTYDTYPSQWGGYNSGINNPKTSYHAHIDNDTFGFNVVEYNESNGQRNWKGINQNGLEKRLSPAQTGIFTFSVDVYATGTGTKLFGGFYYFRKSDGQRGFHSGQFNIQPTEVNKWVRMSAQCRLNDDVDFSKTISFYIYGYGFTTNSILYIKNVKLEYGNKATDWTLAPEDVQAQITDIEGTLASHSTKIEQNAQQIQLRATKAEVDTLTGRVNQAESQITQLAGQVSTKAEASTVTALGNRVTTAEQNISALQGEITQKVSQSTFNALENRVTQAESKITQTANNVTVAFNRIDSIDGVLNSAVTTIDASGVTVKDGSFYLEDDTSDTKYSIVPKTNLLDDHSFEMVERTGSVDPTYGDFAVKQRIDFSGGWRTVGSPRLLSARQTDWAQFSLLFYGLQAIVVSNTNYVEQSFSYISGKTYTVSAYFTGSTRSTSGVPRIDVRLADGLTGEVRKTWTKSFPSVTYGQKLTRYALTFTVPADADDNPGGDDVIVSIRANSGWVVADGVQVVEGETPVLYDPENSVWALLRGDKGYELPPLIVDTGGDSTSGYIRFANGIQLCWGWIQAGVTAGTEWIWWLPAPFSNTNYTVFAQPHRNANDNQYFILRTRQLYQDRVAVRVVYTTSGISGTQQYAQFMAVGRWI